MYKRLFRFLLFMARFYFFSCTTSALWCCFSLLGVRKSVRPVKNWVMRCWCGCLSGMRCKWFAYGPADATTSLSSLALLKSRMVLPFWCWLTQVVLEKSPLNGCLFLYQYSRKRVHVQWLCCLWNLHVAALIRPTGKLVISSYVPITSKI